MSKPTAVNRHVEGTMWKIRNIGTVLTHINTTEHLDECVLCSIGEIIEDLAQKAIDDYGTERRSS